MSTAYVGRLTCCGSGFVCVFPSIGALLEHCLGALTGTYGTQGYSWVLTRRTVGTLPWRTHGYLSLIAVLTLSRTNVAESNPHFSLVALSSTVTAAIAIATVGYCVHTGKPRLGAARPAAALQRRRSTRRFDGLRTPRPADRGLRAHRAVQAATVGSAVHAKARNAAGICTVH